MIVVDDTSATPAEEVLERSSIDASSVWIHRHDTNQDVGAARDIGIRLAPGDWVAFLDDDDEWHPRKVERQLFEAKETRAVVVYTGIVHQRENETTAVKTLEIARRITKQILRRNFLALIRACS